MGTVGTPEGLEAGSARREALRDGVPLVSAGIASCALLCAVVFHGNGEAGRGDRVLGALDFPVFRFRAGAAVVLEWSYAHRSLLALFASLFLVAVAAACARGGRRGLPAALL